MDSAPVGGGAGLVMKSQPIVDCLNAVKEPNSHVILLSPRGETYSQKKAHFYEKSVQNLIILCGHYEGIDERVNRYVDEMISVGDYILTGGEIGAMAISDSIIRLIEGAISEDSIVEESFENGLLEYPQYTEPYDFNGEKIPDILYSGNHTAINKWRKKESLRITKQYRPELIEQRDLSKEEKKLLNELDDPSTPDWEKKAIEKGHKFMKEKRG